MTWLVTGGAGYIGAHVARYFLESGRGVIVLDNLSSGHREFVPADARFVEGSVVDAAAVDDALRGADGVPVTGVVHLAGFKYAGVSVDRPLHTYEQNVTGMRVLLRRRVPGEEQVPQARHSARGRRPRHREHPDAPNPHGGPFIGECCCVTWVGIDLATPAQVLQRRWLGYPQYTTPANLFPLVLGAG
jgi:nucleoside-diphosphate-sugar epimerase